MNLPAGSPVELGINLKEVDLKGTLNNFFTANFSGYACVTIDGYDGVEEGVIVFKAGHPIAFSYSYLKHDKNLSGVQALPRAFNAFRARNGVMDVFATTKEQLELILSFNSDAVLKQVLTQDELDRLTGAPYTEGYAVQVLGRKEEISKRDVLKKYGLSSVEGGGAKPLSKSAAKSVPS